MLEVFADEDLLIDFKLRKVYINDVQVNCQPRLFDTLSYLVQHRDRIVPQDELSAGTSLDHRFPSRRHFNRTMNQRIHHLRAIIGHERIENTESLGWRFMIRSELRSAKEDVLKRLKERARELGQYC